MPNSMTGYGRATGTLNGERVSVELTAVNHRFLDCNFRMPFAWSAVEVSLREALRKQVSRGKVNISIRRERGPAGRPVIRYDDEVSKQYVEASRHMSELMHTTESLSLNTLARLEGVFYTEEEEQDLSLVDSGLQTILLEALVQFNERRATEGEALAEDVRGQIAAMRESVAAVEKEVPGLSRAYEERLRSRMAELNAEAGVKEERLALEVALMADKTAVNEEVVRLKSHFEHVETLLKKAEPIGRELNFLAQEIQREINTLGSKMRDVGVTKEVLKIKCELEKLREQAQNIE